VQLCRYKHINFENVLLLENLVELQLINNKLDDSVFDENSGICRIRVLRVQQCRLTKEGMKKLSCLNHLENLNVAETRYVIRAACSCPQYQLSQNST